VSRTCYVKLVKPAQPRKQKLPLVVLAILLLNLGAFVLGLALVSTVQITGRSKAFARGRPKFEKPPFTFKDRQLGWKLTPNLNVYAKPWLSSQKLLFHTDRYGFRNRERDLPQEGAVMLLGDSFVEGYYLDESETISARLENKINAFVYNFGVGGFSTDQELLVAHAALEKFKTKWVVLFFFINDLPYLEADTAWGFPKPRFEIKNDRVLFDQIRYPEGVPDHGPPFDEDIRYPEAMESIPSLGYRTNYFFVLGKKIEDNFNLLKRAFLSPQETWNDLRTIRQGGMPAKAPFQLESYRNAAAPSDFHEFYVMPGALEREWALAFQMFGRLNEWSAAKDARLVIYFIPEMSQIVPGVKTYFQPQKDFTRLCSQHRLACIEPHRLYLDKQKEQDVYFRDDGHLSPAGAELTAGILGHYFNVEK
jgi:hypothetical protein